MPRPFTEFQKEMAFDQYYAMGSDRSLDTLSVRLVNTKEFKQHAPKLDTLKTWSRKNNWQERCKQRDIENSKPRQKETDREVVKTKASYRVEIADTREQLELLWTHFEKLIADAAEAIKKGEIKITDVNELDRVASGLKKLHDLNKDYLNLDLKLIGEDIPDRSDLNIVLKLPEGWKVDDII